MATLGPEVLAIDAGLVSSEIAISIKAMIRKLNKRGIIIAISGGIDSAVTAALCVQALGANRVYGLLLPETDSSSASARLGELLAQQLGIDYAIQDIGRVLTELGCYDARDDAIRQLFPEYNAQWKSKVAITGGLEGTFNQFNLVVESPTGEQSSKRLKLKEYLQIVAATNYKQRIRKTIEYFHADRLNYAVAGTPNRLEYDQGFFVRNGDGSAEFKPIAHLYKTQVYALADHFELPQEIRSSSPTTDTYSLAQGQDEFYFALAHDKMDLALWAYNHGRSPQELAQALSISADQAQLIFTDIEKKRKTTAGLHWKPLLVEPVDHVGLES